MSDDRRGNPGVPKTKEHRERISASLKARQRDLRARIDEITDAVAPILASGRYSADQMLGLLNAALETTCEAVGIGQDERRVLLSELYETRRELSHRGQAIARADLFELRHLVHAGLLDKDVVESEARRRRESFGQRGSASVESMRGDANLSGYLVCGFPECNRKVDAADGSRCAEHRKTPARQYVTSDYRAVDLDALLADAEKRARKSREQFEDAERDIEALKEHIKTFDKARAK